LFRSMDSPKKSSGLSQYLHRDISPPRAPSGNSSRSTPPRH
jgi:hypothetical protein